MNRIEVQKFIKKFKILDIIIKNPGLSKTQIKIKADLSMESTLSYLDMLEKEGLVVSKLENRKGRPGRKSEAYFPVANSSYYIGIKFLAHRINGVILNLNSDIVYEVEKQYDHRKISQEELLNRIYEIISCLLKEIDKNKLMAIGISCPGLIDSKNGILNHYTSVIDKNIPLKKLVEEKEDVPVYIDSSTKTNALYYKLKNANSNSNLIYVYIGAGVTSSLVIDGKVYRCNNNNDGEIGHLKIANHYGKCSCGRNGCLETIIGNNYIISDLNSKGVNVCTIQGFVDELNKKNEIAISIMNDIVSSLGSVLLNIVTFTAVEELVISGAYTHARQFKDGITKYIHDNCLSEITNKLTIKFILDDNKANAIEAATLAFYQSQSDFN
ncbi:MAG: ROK family transcriptional regulator [Candidatus Caccosoma sp.]|nr:ROK family transcriptional regulator [Candidatus Caccosoma sp.]